MHVAFRQIRRDFDARAKETRFLDYWDQVYPQRLDIVTAFIIESFEKLSCPIRNFGQGEKFPALQQTLAKYYREVPQLWEILEAGIVEKIGGDFIRDPTPLDYNTSIKSAEMLSAQLISDFPQYASTHGLADLLRLHLAECLSRKDDAVSLLFASEKGRSLLEDFCTNAPDLHAATLVL